MLIYMDTCCFNRPYDDQSPIRNSLEAQAKLHIQSRIRSGHLRLATSYILGYENSQNPFIMRKTAISAFLRQYGSGYVSSERGPIVQELAQDIMRSGLKAKDALHVACALDAGCAYFLSTDDRLLRYRHEHLPLLNPMDFIRMEADKQ